MDEKAVISVQFNWIMVMIIGGLILLFFITIVQKQKIVSEENIAETIQLDLQAILTSSHVSTDTASIIEVPNKEITFSCEGFKLGNQFPAKFPYAFGPNLIKSDRNTISVFSYDWSVPYRVTNFLYVTSPDVKYVIDQNTGDNIIRALEELLPPRYIAKDGKQRLFMNWDKGPTTNIQNANNYKIRIVSFNCVPNIGAPTITNTNIDEKDVSLVCINTGSCTSDDPLDCAGVLKFYNYNENGAWTFTDSYFAGKASLLAAIFSENAAIYECGMENAIDRFGLVTDIYESKITQIKSSSGVSIVCQGLYPNNLELTISNIGDAYNLVGGLESTNEDLLMSSCPPIY